MAPQLTVDAPNLAEEASARTDSALRPRRRPALIALPERGASEELDVSRPAKGALAAPRFPDSLQRRLLAAADVGAVGLALLAVAQLSPGQPSALVAVAVVPFVPILFKLAALYDRDEVRLVHSTLDETPLLLQLTGLLALGVTMLSPAVTGARPGAAEIATLWAAMLAGVTGGRLLARAMVRRVSPPERCLVIGEAAQVGRIRERLAASRAHARVIGYLPLTSEQVEELGSPETIHSVATDLSVQRIIIALSTSDTTGVVGLIRAAKIAGVKLSVLPLMFEAVGVGVHFDEVDGMTMLGVRRFGMSRSSRAIKRAFDIVATLLGLIVAGPVIACLAVAVRLDSEGPVFFRQVRVGRDGNHFRIVKFRSMVADAEMRKATLLSRNEAGDGLFKIRDDPRVTRVGGVLRRTSLDELPQLFNVLRGEMSLVGPRPLVVDEDERVFGLDRSRLDLTPGMTGPWQVLGARVPLHEMVGIDYLYVANWSLWLDVKILARTVAHVFRRGNV
jgi:exopolysaccharide biosynthesis polyprenyl glycosylphosphotransferase